MTNENDVAALVGYLSGATPPFAEYSTDIDRSGQTTPHDILTLIDLINGAGNLEPWNGTVRQSCGTCFSP